MGRRIFIHLIFIIMTLFASAVPSGASKCDDHGVLQDSDHYAAKWEWGAGNRAIIHIWDSPSLVAIVGNVHPGAYVEILEEKDGFYRVKTTKEQGGIMGWVRKEQVASLLPRRDAQPHECFAGIP